ncbi:MAG TPA: MlaD family protein [Sediminibacterium sp.]|nr:MlaD family protein [Sediminibacterium sp.]
MAKQTFNNVRLGAFVLAGLTFIIVLLYLIGKNQHLFGSSFVLKVQLDNVQGLKSGNNVRYGGIDVGTVKKINILNDTLMEVEMVIDEMVKQVIRKNAIVSIRTDGLVGNKVVEISSSKKPALPVEDGDVLSSRKSIDTDEMLRTLSKTNNDLAIITEGLKTTIGKINNSTALWNLLNEEGIPSHLKRSAYNIHQATDKANKMIADLQSIVLGVKNGKGSLGAIVTDTALGQNLNAAVLKIKEVGDQADLLSQQISSAVKGIQRDIDQGPGTVNTLLKDSAMANKLNRSLDNIQKGTDGFNQNMEALKHNFLFRGYFRKLEKEKKKQAEQNQ